MRTPVAVPSGFPRPAGLADSVAASLPADVAAAIKPRLAALPAEALSDALETWQFSCTLGRLLRIQPMPLDTFLLALVSRRHDYQRPLTQLMASYVRFLITGMGPCGQRWTDSVAGLSYAARAARRPLMRTGPTTGDTPADLLHRLCRELLAPRPYSTAAAAPGQAGPDSAAQASAEPAANPYADGPRPSGPADTPAAPKPAPVAATATPASDMSAPGPDKGASRDRRRSRRVAAAAAVAAVSAAAAGEQRELDAAAAVADGSSGGGGAGGGEGSEKGATGEEIAVDVDGSPMPVASSDGAAMARGSRYPGFMTLTSWSPPAQHDETRDADLTQGPLTSSGKVIAGPEADTLLVARAGALTQPHTWQEALRRLVADHEKCDVVPPQGDAMQSCLALLHLLMLHPSSAALGERWADVARGQRVDASLAAHPLDYRTIATRLLGGWYGRVPNLFAVAGEASEALREAAAAQPEAQVAVHPGGGTRGGGPAAFIADVRLLLHNGRKAFASNAAPYHAAVKLGLLFERMVAKRLRAHAAAPASGLAAEVAADAVAAAAAAAAAEEDGEEEDRVTDPAVRWHGRGPWPFQRSKEEEDAGLDVASPAGSAAPVAQEVVDALGSGCVEDLAPQLKCALLKWLCERAADHGAFAAYVDDCADAALTLDAELRAGSEEVAATETALVRRQRMIDRRSGRAEQLEASWRADAEAATRGVDPRRAALHEPPRPNELRRVQRELRTLRAGKVVLAASLRTLRARADVLRWHLGEVEMRVRPLARDARGCEYWLFAWDDRPRLLLCCPRAAADAAAEGTTLPSDAEDSSAPEDTGGDGGMEGEEEEGEEEEEEKAEEKVEEKKAEEGNAAPAAQRSARKRAARPEEAEGEEAGARPRRRRRRALAGAEAAMMADWTMSESEDDDDEDGEGGESDQHASEDGDSVSDEPSSDEEFDASTRAREGTPRVHRRRSTGHGTSAELQRGAMSVASWRLLSTSNPQWRERPLKHEAGPSLTNGYTDCVWVAVEGREAVTRLVNALRDSPLRRDREAGSAVGRRLGTSLTGLAGDADNGGDTPVRDTPREYGARLLEQERALAAALGLADPESGGSAGTGKRGAEALADASAQLREAAGEGETSLQQLKAHREALERLAADMFAEEEEEEGKAEGKEEEEEEVAASAASGSAGPSEQPAAAMEEEEEEEEEFHGGEVEEWVEEALEEARAAEAAVAGAEEEVEEIATASLPQAESAVAASLLLDARFDGLVDASRGEGWGAAWRAFVDQRHRLRREGGGDGAVLSALRPLLAQFAPTSGAAAPRPPLTLVAATRMAIRLPPALARALGGPAGDAADAQALRTLQRARQACAKLLAAVPEAVAESVVRHDSGKGDGVVALLCAGPGEGDEATEDVGSKKGADVPLSLSEDEEVALESRAKWLAGQLKAWGAVRGRRAEGMEEEEEEEEEHVELSSSGTRSTLLPPADVASFVAELLAIDADACHSDAGGPGWVPETVVEDRLAARHARERAALAAHHSRLQAAAEAELRQDVAEAQRRAREEQVQAYTTVDGKLRAHKESLAETDAARHAATFEAHRMAHEAYTALEKTLDARLKAVHARARGIAFLFATRCKEQMRRLDARHAATRTARALLALRRDAVGDAALVFGAGDAAPPLQPEADASAPRAACPARLHSGLRTAVASAAAPVGARARDGAAPPRTAVPVPEAWSQSPQALYGPSMRGPPGWLDLSAARACYAEACEARGLAAQPDAKGAAVLPEEEVEGVALGGNATAGKGEGPCAEFTRASLCRAYRCVPVWRRVAELLRVANALGGARSAWRAQLAVCASTREVAPLACALLGLEEALFVRSAAGAERRSTWHNARRDWAKRRHAWRGAVEEAGTVSHLGLLLLQWRASVVPSLGLTRGAFLALAPPAAQAYVPRPGQRVAYLGGGHPHGPAAPPPRAVSPSSPTTAVVTHVEYHAGAGEPYAEVTLAPDAVRSGDRCAITFGDGELLECEFPCSRVYSPAALGLDKVPDGVWTCPAHRCAACAHPLTRDCVAPGCADPLTEAAARAGDAAEKEGQAGTGLLSVVCRAGAQRDTPAASCAHCPISLCGACFQEAVLTRRRVEALMMERLRARRRRGWELEVARLERLRDAHDAGHTTDKRGDPLPSPERAAEALLARTAGPATEDAARVATAAWASHAGWATGQEKGPRAETAAAASVVASASAMRAGAFDAARGAAPLAVGEEEAEVARLRGRLELRLCERFGGRDASGRWGCPRCWAPTRRLGRLLGAVVEEVASREEAAPFRTLPVVGETPHAEAYLEEVADPLCLADVAARARCGRYVRAAEMLQDVREVREGAVAFWGHGSGAEPAKAEQARAVYRRVAARLGELRAAVEEAEEAVRWIRERAGLGKGRNRTPPRGSAWDHDYLDVEVEALEVAADAEEDERDKTLEEAEAEEAEAEGGEEEEGSEEEEGGGRSGQASPAAGKGADVPGLRPMPALGQQQQQQQQLAEVSQEQRRRRRRRERRQQRRRRGPQAVRGVAAFLTEVERRGMFTLLSYRELAMPRVPQAPMEGVERTFSVLVPLQHRPAGSAAGSAEGEPAAGTLLAPVVPGSAAYRRPPVLVEASRFAEYAAAVSAARASEEAVAGEARAAQETLDFQRALAGSEAARQLSLWRRYGAGENEAGPLAPLGRALARSQADRMHAAAEEAAAREHALGRELAALRRIGALHAGHVHSLLERASRVRWPAAKAVVRIAGGAAASGGASRRLSRGSRRDSGPGNGSASNGGSTVPAAAVRANQALASAAGPGSKPLTLAEGVDVPREVVRCAESLVRRVESRHGAAISRRAIGSARAATRATLTAMVDAVEAVHTLPGSAVVARMDAGDADADGEGVTPATLAQAESAAALSVYTEVSDMRFRELCAQGDAASEEAAKAEAAAAAAELDEAEALTSLATLASRAVAAVRGDSAGAAEGGDAHPANPLLPPSERAAQWEALAGRPRPSAAAARAAWLHELVQLAAGLPVGAAPLQRVREELERARRDASLVCAVEDARRARELRRATPRKSIADTGRGGVRGAVGTERARRRAMKQRRRLLRDQTKEVLVRAGRELQRLRIERVEPDRVARETARRSRLQQLATVAQHPVSALPGVLGDGGPRAGDGGGRNPVSVQLHPAVASAAGSRALPPPATVYVNAAQRQAATMVLRAGAVASMKAGEGSAAAREHAMRHLGVDAGGSGGGRSLPRAWLAGNGGYLPGGMRVRVRVDGRVQPVGFVVEVNANLPRTDDARIPATMPRPRGRPRKEANRREWETEDGGGGRGGGDVDEWRSSAAEEEEEEEAGREVVLGSEEESDDGAARREGPRPVRSQRAAAARASLSSWSMALKEEDEGAKDEGESEGEGDAPTRKRARQRGGREAAGEVVVPARLGSGPYAGCVLRVRVGGVSYVGPTQALVQGSAEVQLARGRGPVPGLVMEDGQLGDDDDEEEEQEEEDGLYEGQVVDEAIVVGQGQRPSRATARRSSAAAMAAAMEAEEEDSGGEAKGVGRARKRRRA